jgi:hypothetical protein
LTGESVGELLSSEITTFRVPPPCTEGEGHADSSVNCELLNDLAESVEERTLTRRNTVEAAANRTQGRLFASFGLYGVRRRAEQHKDEKFTALLHHITPTLLRESYYLLKRDAAYGVDEQTWDEYYVDHYNRIDELHEICGVKSCAATF